MSDPPNKLAPSHPAETTPIKANEPTAMLLAPNTYIWVECKGVGLYRAAAHANGLEVAASMGETREASITHLLARLVMNTARLRELEKTHTHAAGSC